MTDAKDPRSLTGMGVVVVGSTGKVGSHLVHGLAVRGARVMALGRSAERLSARLADTWHDVATRVEIEAADLSSDAGMIQAAKAAEARLGAIDAVVDAVGRFHPGSLVSDPWDVWERAYEDNLAVHLRLVRALVPRLAARRREDPTARPCLTFIQGLAGETPNPAGGAMAVTGAAEAMLTRVMVREAGAQGVRVNGVVLGPVATHAALAEGHPERVTGEDVADVVAYLVSPAAVATHGSFVLLKERACLPD